MCWLRFTFVGIADKEFSSPGEENRYPTYGIISVCACCMTLSIHIKWIHLVLPHVRHFHHQVRKTLTPFVHVADALSLEDKNTRWLQSYSSKRDESGKHYGSQRGMRAAHTRVYARPTLRHPCHILLLLSSDSW